ncbi:MAG: fibronectin type III-like domain-contianing protein, partial [Anaerolineales bacterium]
MAKYYRNLRVEWYLVVDPYFAWRFLFCQVILARSCSQFQRCTHESRLVRPPKELKGFAKVELEPGETKTVSVPLDFRAFAYYDPAYRQWITEDGEYDILIGA